MYELAIIDWSTSTIHIYPVDTNEITDEYVESLGYKMSQCHYLVAPKINIERH